MSAAIYRAWHNWATDGVLDIDPAVWVARPELHPACEAACYLTGVDVNDTQRVRLTRNEVRVTHLVRRRDGSIMVNGDDIVSNTVTLTFGGQQ